MKSRFPSLYLCGGLLALAVVGLFISFVFEANAATESSISVDIVPENPAPGENVDITLSSYANNLDATLISWKVNGTQSLSGIGKKTLSVTAPSAGSEINIAAIISLPDGTVEKRAAIRPAVMVLLWQANDSHVPPFYKGKAMPTSETEIKVVAMPEIRSGSQTINSKNLVYAWSQDYSNDQEGSGYGKNYFTYLNDYLDNLNNISVTASTVDQKYSSAANIEVTTWEPKIVFYKNDPEMGTMWEKAISNGHTISGDEIIEAVPYFMSPKDIRIPVLVWNWSINDSPVSILGAKKNMLPLAVEEGITGRSKIKLEITNNTKIFQTAFKEISVEF